MRLHSYDRGFTLLEMIVGIAISSVLLVAVFQFLGKLITFRQSLVERGLKNQERVNLAQLLHHDLMSIPRGEMKFSGDRNQFTRRTVSHETDESKWMDVLVRYRIRNEQGKDHLYRSWRWSDIHSDYQESERLLTAKSITINYRATGQDWHQIPREDRPDAIRISWNDRSTVSPLAPKRREW